MPHRSTLRPAVSAALALAVIAACAPPTQPTGGTGTGTRTRLTSPPPGGQPPASTGPAATGPDPATPPSAAASAPASPGPGVSPGVASPAASAPLPLPSADPRRTLIASKLLNLAKVAFTQNRGELAAGKAFEGAGAALLGNNGAGIIANNGAGILSNNGSGLITDNGAGIVANNGGGIIANNGATYRASLPSGAFLRPGDRGYRLAQAASPEPALEVAIATTAQPGETLRARRLWPDGVTLLRFDRAGADGDPVRRIVHLRDGEPYYEEAREVLARWPDGKEKQARAVTIERIAKGRFVYRLIQTGEAGEDGKTTRIVLEPGSVVRDEATGGVTALRQALDMVAKTGTFRYEYRSLGLVEAGTFDGIRTALGGGVQLAFWDPLAAQDGESTVTDAAGTKLYTKRQTREGTTVRRDFDLGDGITLAVRRVGDDVYEGRLAEAQRETADVKLEARTDGSAVFTVTFDDAKEQPMVIGYGLGEQTLGTRPQAPTPYVVLTSLGNHEAGHVNGSKEQTKFDKPMAFVRSRLTDAKFYVADALNHRIRLVKKPFASAAYAGDGTPGHRDGDADQAQFNEPYGLAVGPDDTLYVTENEGQRIRVISPSGVVSTLAGDGTAGFADGVGPAARFDHPIGAALDDQGRLYVADGLNHRIRRIETSGPDRGKVTTMAGDGTVGFADGPGAAARFGIPYGLALGPGGDLFIADRDNNRIRKMTPEGVVTTVAGTSDRSRDYFDGPALEAGFNPPRFLAFAPDGNLYFTTGADVYVLTNGEVRSYAGVGAPGWRDGVAKFAAFRDCQGLAFANNGSMHLMDGNLVRTIVPASALSGD